MGAWDTGPFDNDTAMDLLGELTELPAEQRPERVRGALQCGEGYLANAEAEEAVAAAALVAAASGMEIREPDEAAQLVADGSIPDDEEDRELARAALIRVGGKDSEWRELGTESGTLEEMLTVCEELRDYL